MGQQLSELSCSAFKKNDRIILLEEVRTLRGVFQKGLVMKVLEGNHSNFTLVDSRGSLLLSSDINPG